MHFILESRPEIFKYLNLLHFRGEFFVAGEHSSHVPIVEAREWGVKAFNYDNCGIAMITLFAVQTTEGWVDVLQVSHTIIYLAILIHDQVLFLNSDQNVIILHNR